MLEKCNSLTRLDSSGDDRERMRTVTFTSVLSEKKSISAKEKDVLIDNLSSISRRKV